MSKCQNKFQYNSLESTHMGENIGRSKNSRVSKCKFSVFKKAALFTI